MTEKLAQMKPQTSSEGIRIQKQELHCGSHTAVHCGKCYSPASTKRLLTKKINKEIRHGGGLETQLIFFSFLFSARLPIVLSLFSTKWIRRIQRLFFLVVYFSVIVFPSPPNLM